ncbi:MAG: DinB family protein, partial [Pyrinomonadaceae bacterium]
ADVKATLAKLTADDLAANYPLEVFGHPMTTEYFVVHLATHLNYHLGQINYHRRLLSK